ncbi:hypothetical protein MLD38_036056 [Melastoma candidum]|uniref:Uncharacterized protein n=1 Tax=Melastoma candidum TaxID=119954 RepID=A0ACB9LIQ6_9MYRT|nr:hypothetical protein MLD38_036056 [Melastoma candidum]
MGYASETPKHRLVVEICSSPRRTGDACAHLVPRRSLTCFVDWYLLLGVEENADGNVIRRRYRELALQVHPDKNDHPDAGIAFKLLAEAYNCLSNAASRKAFDEAKQKNACPQCRNSQLCHAPKPVKLPDIDMLENIGDRFREEVRVINSCLRAYVEKPTTKGYPQRCYRSKTAVCWSFEKKESPVFDSSRHAFSGYPHVRSRVAADKGVWEQPRCKDSATGVARA